MKKIMIIFLLLFLVTGFTYSQSKTLLEGDSTATINNGSQQAYCYVMLGNNRSAASDTIYIQTYNLYTSTWTNSTVYDLYNNTIILPTTSIKVPYGVTRTYLLTETYASKVKVIRYTRDTLDKSTYVSFKFVPSIAIALSTVTAVVSGEVTAVVDSTSGSRSWINIVNWTTMLNAIDSLLHVYIMNEVQIRNNYDNTKKIMSKWDTLGTSSSDTLFRIFFPNSVDTNASHFYLDWYALTIDNPDDTVYISDTPDGSGVYNQILLPQRAWNSPRFSVASYPRLYFIFYGTMSSGYKIYPTVYGY